jgi:hypothetical protein
MSGSYATDTARLSITRLFPCILRYLEDSFGRNLSFLGIALQGVKMFNHGWFLERRMVSHSLDQNAR